MVSAGETRVLVVHDRPQSYWQEMQTRFPNLALAVAQTPEEVTNLMAEFKPTVVYSCKTQSMGGTAHAPIVNGQEVAWIHVGGAGFDHLGQWDPGKMQVTNSSGVLSRYLAETVMGAIIAMNYGLHSYIHQQRRHLWAPVDWTSLQGKTLLIVGLGKIGLDLARNAKHFGMRVIGVRRGDSPAPIIDQQLPLTALHEGLAEADVVALHCPLTNETRDLIDAEALAQMKPGALLVNAARGPVVNEHALIAALQAGAIKGAFLDVVEKEPLTTDSPLWDMENVVISPHNSDQVADWEYRFAHFFMENLEKWVTGQPLLNVVDPQRGY